MAKYPTDPRASPPFAGSCVSKKKRRKGARSNRSRSTLGQHKRVGSTLLPPFLDPHLNLTYLSWVNERLPEMAWAALLVSGLGRVRALQRFREIAGFIHKLPEEHRFWDVSLTAIARLPRPLASSFLQVVARGSRSASALTPLLLLESLPARDLWRGALGHAEKVLSWRDLGSAITTCFDHQSQEATDCRWLKVLARMVAGHLFLPTREIAREVAEYPSHGDMRKVRPSVRAMELSLADATTPSAWSVSFWQECFANSPSKN